EHDCEQDAVVLALSVGSGDEHGLSGVAALLRPRGRVAALEVGLDDSVEPARGRAHAPGVVVGALVAAPVVDARELDRLLDQPFARERAAGWVDPEALERRHRRGLAFAQAL